MTIKVKSFSNQIDAVDEQLNQWLEYIQEHDPMFKLIDIKYTASYILNDTIEFMNTSALVIFNSSFEDEGINFGHDVA